MTGLPVSLPRRFRLSAALVVAFGPCVALAGPVEPAPTPVIRIDNFTFNPETITVAPGTTVTWINGDDIPHTVVSSSGRFRSKPLDTEDRFAFTFEAGGEYPYFCSLHPHMTGKVIVRNAPE